MANYSVAEAKNRLPALIDKALDGEEIVITRRGKPVVELRPAGGKTSSHTGTHAWLQGRRRSRPPVGFSSLEMLDLLYEHPED